MDYLQPRMPYFMIPRFIRSVDSFPKTGTQRTQKNKLRESRSDQRHLGHGGSWLQVKKVIGFYEDLSSPPSGFIILLPRYRLVVASNSLGKGP